MPQSEEHMAVLDLLEVHHGVIALTRTDLADEETTQLAELEIEEQVAGTTLAAWPVVAVSAISGAGLDELRARLAEALDAAGEPPDIGWPRLWIDRSFVIAGAGVVVTGTLLDGVLSAGQLVELWPGPHPARIRSLQSHETELASARPGSRVAANLAGLERDAVARGALLTLPGRAASSNRFLASGRPVRGVDEITDRGAYQLHAGSGAWPVKVRAIDGATLLITSAATIPLACGDRYILRETGRRAIVGGGRVLDPRPAGRNAADLSHAARVLRPTLAGGPDVLATALLEVRGVAAIDELEIDSRGGRPAGALLGSAQAMQPDRAAAAADSIASAVRTFHEANPLRPGIPKATLASSQGLEPALLDAVLAQREDLVDDGATVRTATHGAEWSPVDEEAWQAAGDQLRASGLAAPRAKDLGLRPELMHAAVRTGRLTRIAEDLVYLPEQLTEIVERLGELPAEFTVAEFRDQMGISRRQAVPLLEWLDNEGWTSRRGDVRTLRRSPRR